MSYLVLARKYRPQTFADVVQQEQVTQTLSNAISANRVAHAVLFTGPRGTGKTTIARILAKAMNCEQGPTPTPCNQCRSCQEITAGHAADVFEIDGASNNSVNEVRELRSNIKFMPAHSPYKIYIIDEVHMLSLAAFNALLKTLEEPPPHVMFLFATTEPHKIPATILSRCQRHDLSYVSPQAAIDHLTEICRQEETPLENRTLTVIAREAGGSIRDALSLLDQVLSTAAANLTHDMILDLLGIIDQDLLFELSAAVFNRRLNDVLDILEKSYRQGQDIKKFYAEILTHFRNLLVIKLGQTSSGPLSLSPSEIAHLREQVEPVAELHLSQILSLLLAEEELVRFSSRPKIAVELAFIKLLQTSPALPLEELVEKIEALKDQLGRLPAAGAPSVAEGAATGASSPLPDDTPATAEKPGPGTGTAPTTTEQGQNEEPPHPAQAVAEAPPEPAPAPDFPDTDAHQAGPNQDLPDPAQAWEKILARVEARNTQLAASLTNSTLARLDQQTLEIEVYGSQYNLNLLNREKNQSDLQDICASVLNLSGLDIRIHHQQTQSGSAPEKAPDTTAGTATAPRAPSPLVAEAQEIFKGTIVNSN